MDPADMTKPRFSRAAALALALAALAGCQTPGAGEPHPGAGTPWPKTPKVHFNQDYIEGLYTEIDISNPKNVFELVFAQLRDTVTVYPTENYYYFSFNTGGKTYWGNLRLDASDRDKGVIHMGYFKFDDYQRYRESNNYYKLFGKEDGVEVKKVRDLVYAVSYKGRTVTFRFYDIGLKPPVKAKLAPGEVYVGPVFDESGTRFFLIFSRIQKNFFYVLNEDDVMTEKFEPINPLVVAGERTGFAYYLDAKYDRKVLIAIHGVNAQKNNYYDGPFDQLPDNYNDKIDMRKYLEEAYPGIKGKINSFGIYIDRPAARVAISRYYVYQDPRELGFVYDCLRLKLPEPKFYACITPEENY
jgi:hypothetical protein